MRAHRQPHVVVDLGDGADGRARVLRGGLLLDRDRGRQAVDLVDVRLLHHLEELPRIGGEGLHIAALALGIDGVEGERGFARAGQAGEHHKPVARDRDVDIPEIVFAGAADRYLAGVTGGIAGAFSHRIRSTLWNGTYKDKRTPPARQRCRAARACWRTRRERLPLRQPGFGIAVENLCGRD